MNRLFKITRYLWDAKHLMWDIPNWHELVWLVLGINKNPRIKIRNLHFRIAHYLDVLTLKETLLDRQYPLNKKAKVIIDIGANIGDYAILSANSNKSARVFAFEPSYKTFEMLCENLVLNASHNVTAICKGVMSKPGTVYLYSQKASGLSSVYNKRENYEKQAISVTSLPQIIDQYKLRNVDLVKMDCEGAEFDILLNLPKKYMKAISSFSIEYHDRLNGHHHHELEKLLLKNKYSVQIIPHALESGIGIIHAKR